jgi:glycosyltransferase involved in cell wall biosynthesis
MTFLVASNNSESVDLGSVVALNHALTCCRPAVTIIIINWNLERFVARVTRSVLTQTLGDIEVLVAADSSTDSSLAIMANFSQSDDRIRYFVNNPQLRTNGNMAKAVFVSRGMFLQMLDSDDELCNRTAEVNRKTALLLGSDMIEHRAVRVCTDGRRGPFQYKSAPFRTGNTSHVINAFCADRMNWTFWREMILRRLYRCARLCGG